MSWQDYVDKQLLASRCVTKAAIAGHDGNVWAKSEGFDISKDEVAKIVAGFADESLLTGGGVTIAGTRYIYLSGTDRIIRAKLGKVGVHCMKTQQVVEKRSTTFLSSTCISSPKYRWPNGANLFCRMASAVWQSYWDQSAAQKTDQVEKPLTSCQSPAAERPSGRAAERPSSRKDAQPRLLCGFWILFYTLTASSE
ncbi:Profilin [Papilio machaon]|uniref:Profilin n=1 Tax=Papilio machaon TaxID=76193 RepID=A0A194QSF2_PAPMA|nr:Profilin [Papilio machaon]